MADYPPIVAGAGWAYRQAIARQTAGEQTLLKANFLVVEMETEGDLPGDRHVFSTNTKSYRAGEQTDPEVSPAAILLGAMQLDEDMEAATPRFIHVCGSLADTPCESVEALEARLALATAGGTDPILPVLFGTHEIPAEERTEYEGGQAISAGITVAIDDAT